MYPHSPRAYTRETQRLDEPQRPAAAPQPRYGVIACIAALAVLYALARAGAAAPARPDPAWAPPPAQSTYTDNSVNLCVGYCPAAR